MRVYAVIFKIIPLKTATLYDVEKICYGTINNNSEFIVEKKPRQKKEERYASIIDERALFDEFDDGKKAVYFYGFPITKQQLQERYPDVSSTMAKKKYGEAIKEFIYLGNFDSMSGKRYYRVVDPRNLVFKPINFLKPFDEMVFEREEEKSKKKIKR